MEIDFTRLKYFVAVADELHFKRAADRLRITPPPLSKQIKLLERELGGPLFERHYHEVRLTPLGEALLGPARAILRQVDGLKDIAAGVLEDGTPIQDRISNVDYTLLCLNGRHETAPLENAFRGRSAPLSVLQFASKPARMVYERDLILLRPDMHVVWRGNSLPDNPAELAALATGHGRMLS